MARTSRRDAADTPRARSRSGDSPERRGEPEERDHSRAVYIISVAADLAGVHPQTLRIYERKGLIEPERTPGGSRRYSDDDIERLKRIQELTGEGVSLAGVELFIELEERLDTARHEIRRLRRSLAQLREEHRKAVEAVHRSYRRDLVPVRNELDVYRRRRRSG